MHWIKILHRHKVRQNFRRGGKIGSSPLAMHGSPGVYQPVYDLSIDGQAAPVPKA
jgi:hypothetical protein